MVKRPIAMHRLPRLQRLLRLCCLGLLAACLARPAVAGPPPWTEASFTYFADRQPLVDVLSRFAGSFGLEPLLSPAVRAANPHISGKFTTVNPSEFLNQIGSAYGLSWFTYDGKLYVSKSNERSTQALAPPGVGVASLKQALTELGIYEEKFGWGDIPDRGMVLISGPPAYVQLIKRAVAELPPLAPDQQFQMFRLRYAQVDDRTIFFRDKEITTSGVATILRGLVSGDGSKSGTSVALTEMAAPLRAISPLGQDRTDAAPPPATDGRTAAVPPARERQRPVIQADSRLNAVIVRDRPENMPIYRDLIAILDVPSQLIEIEAMIVDVNSRAASELGLDWRAASRNLAAGFGNLATDPASRAATLAFGHGINPNTMVANATSYLLARIRALESDGNARVVSRPSILTMDNLGALIDLSDTFYIQSIGERVTSVVPVSVGVSLRVTPRIIDEGGSRAVQLTVDIEDGVIQSQADQNNAGSSLPRVRRSTIGTQAVMREDESLLIGGFNAEQDILEKEGVPGLSSLPLLGSLFSKTTSSTGRQERLFVITPRIVSSTGQTVRQAMPPLRSLESPQRTQSQPTPLQQPRQAQSTNPQPLEQQPLEQPPLEQQLLAQPLERPALASPPLPEQGPQQENMEHNRLEQHSLQEAPLQRSAPVPVGWRLDLNMELDALPDPGQQRQ